MAKQLDRRSFVKIAGAASAMASAGWLWQATVGMATARNLAAAAASTSLLDTLVLGDAASEAAHAISVTLSDVVSGGLGQPARVFNPTNPDGYWGGSAKCTMACAPTGTTYVTVKLWGSDKATSDNTAWRLQLFAEGKQVGHQEQSPVDSIDIMSRDPRLTGRFYFHTLPLPEAMTAGKTSIELEIRSMGRIWSYGQNPNQFYYNMTSPSRGVYRVYTHVEPYFAPDADELQGEAPTPGIRPAPGAEVLDQVKARVQQELSTWLYTRSTDLWAIQALAEAYSYQDSICYQNPDTLDRIFSDLDAVSNLWANNRTHVSITDQQWGGLGKLGYILTLIKDNIGDRLDKPVTSGAAGFVNGGVEAGSTAPIGWRKVTWSGSATFTWDSEVKRSGSRSLKLTPNAAGYGPGWGSARFGVQPGTYEYASWVKMENVSGTGVYKIAPEGCRL